MKIPNLAYLRTVSSPQFPDLGSKLFEALQAIAQQASNVEQQVNGNPAGLPQAPPSPNGVKVSGQNGHFSVAITDTNQIYRGIQYFIAHADNPNFTNPVIVPLGASRNAHLFLGNVSRYFMAYSSYGSSSPSEPVFHGGEGRPSVVNGGGSIGGPAFLPSQGSGTGDPGVGLSGPGPVPFRSVTGIPPVR